MYRRSVVFHLLNDERSADAVKGLEYVCAEDYEPDHADYAAGYFDPPRQFASENDTEARGRHSYYGDEESYWPSDRTSEVF